MQDRAINRFCEDGDCHLETPRTCVVSRYYLLKLGLPPCIGSATLANARLGPDLRGWTEDPEGAEAYPITIFTWLMFYKTQDAKKAAVLRQLVEYCASKGQALADNVGYVPSPANVVRKDQGRSR